MVRIPSRVLKGRLNYFSVENRLILEKESYKKRIILASASPRRSEILRILKIGYKVVRPRNCKEVLFEDPYKTVVSNSIIKAKNVYNNIKKGLLEGRDSGYKGLFLIAGFDTVVYFKRKCFGKPGSIEDAEKILCILSGRVHKVISGVCVLNGISEEYHCDSETTGVKFRSLKQEEIRAYLDREEVLDKAGAYNIFGSGSLLVEKIDGCFFNAAGLPVVKFVNLLERFGFRVIS
jgi:septum formation protein